MFMLSKTGTTLVRQLHELEEEEEEEEDDLHNMDVCSMVIL
jgi:hypothetical protein